MKMRLKQRLSTRLMGLGEKNGAVQRQADDDVDVGDVKERSRPCMQTSPSTPRPNENAIAINEDDAACDNHCSGKCKTNNVCLESGKNIVEQTNQTDDVDINNKDEEDHDHEDASANPMMAALDDDDSDSSESYNPRLRGRWAEGSEEEDGSDSEDDSSSSGSVGDDLADLGLPSGYLEYLSRQQSDVDDELSNIADRLRGTDGIRCPSPLLQISFVREFVYDKGAMVIANAIKEGCSTCPEKHNHCCISSREDTSLDSTGKHNLSTYANNARALEAQDKPLLASPISCSCPSNLREIVLSRCHIGDEGASALAYALSVSGASLKTLDLSSNNIAGAGAACLANCTVLRQEKSGSGLTYDTLDNCGEGSCSIDTLVLSSNPIQSTGAFALANALRGCTSRCCSHQKAGSKGSQTISSQDVNNANGFCSLKKLHLSGCKLTDDDAQILGSAILPHRYDSHHGKSEPAYPQANKLMLLNLHANCITVTGMEYLHSIIHYSTPDPAQRNSFAGDESGLPCLQTLYSQSNHTVELGLIVDYGTRDYNYGHFFDQEEDEKLLINMRKYEMTGMEPQGVDIEELKSLMIQKWLLKEKMMQDLRINRECATALEHAAREEERQHIICSNARKKISQVLESKLHPSPIILPRRQDEYGKYLDEGDPLGLGWYSMCLGSEIASIGRHFTSLELNLFPQVLSWIDRNCSQPRKLAMVFDILCENPDVCIFHSQDTTSSGKMPCRPSLAASIVSHRKLSSRRLN